MHRGFDAVTRLHARADEDADQARMRVSETLGALAAGLGSDAQSLEEYARSVVKSGLTGIDLAAHHAEAAADQARAHEEQVAGSLALVTERAECATLAFTVQFNLGDTTALTYWLYNLSCTNGFKNVL